MGMRNSPKVTLTLVCAFVGYLGVAIFYSDRIGLNLGTRLLCPGCPHVDGPGNPLTFFVRVVIFVGTLNAAFFILVGWALFFSLKLARRLASNRS
jgi:hypothetical protein